RRMYPSPAGCGRSSGPDPARESGQGQDFVKDLEWHEAAQRLAGAAVQAALVCSGLQPSVSLRGTLEARLRRARALSWACRWR
ncbi:MAG: hypothetical protein OXF73_03875, partial [Gammaproteobacteria bacterium]|nr:hypothetical protein [Gammaproteobacteria bacterium]